MIIYTLDLCGLCNNDCGREVSFTYILGAKSYLSSPFQKVGSYAVSGTIGLAEGPGPGEGCLCSANAVVFQALQYLSHQ